MSKFISTRGHTIKDGAKSFEDVLLTGLAPDGGLYVPEKFPHFSEKELRELAGKPYIEVASAVMWPFVEGSIAREDFDAMVAETYDRNVFDHQSITPLVQLDSKLWLMELHRGPTIAFKRHINALKSGDYSARILLRRHDAFNDVAHELNDLAEILETIDKSSKTQSTEKSTA